MPAEQAKIVNFFLKHGGIVNVKISGDAINLGEAKELKFLDNITSKASHVKKNIHKLLSQKI